MVLCLAGCARNEHATPPPRDPVRITQFYATKVRVPRGESASLCYGVDNAKAVRINPPVERLWPAMSRCFPVSPQETTTYTLIAEDSQGQTDSKSVLITATAPAPHLEDLNVTATDVTAGQLIGFCFKAKNAVALHGGPGSFQHGGALEGDCLMDTPRQTTSYKITIEGPDGQTDEASITVKVH